MPNYALNYVVVSLNGRIVLAKIYDFNPEGRQAAQAAPSGSSGTVSHQLLPHLFPPGSLSYGNTDTLPAARPM